MVHGAALAMDHLSVPIVAVNGKVDALGVFGKRDGNCPDGGYHHRLQPDDVAQFDG